VILLCVIVPSPRDGRQAFGMLGRSRRVAGGQAPPLMRRALRRLPLLAVVLAALAFALVVGHAPLLRSVGTWLRVEGRLEHADAIVVLAGGTPRREAMAAALWKDGWAPRILISRPYERPEIRELIALGVRRHDLQTEAKQALESYGVPADRITAIPDISRTTEPELALVRDTARKLGYTRLILVTSPQHTRRVRLIWTKQTDGAPEGIVVPTRERFPFDDWWRRRRAAESVLHEYLGLLAVSLGISHLFR
jgi:uncharacterized SAM-binding protein YcdF (DUF218 family)